MVQNFYYAPEYTKGLDERVEVVFDYNPARMPPAAKQLIRTQLEWLAKISGRFDLRIIEARDSHLGYSIYDFRKGRQVCFVEVSQGYLYSMLKLNP